jgi:hypothetical protein
VHSRSRVEGEAYFHTWRLWSGECNRVIENPSLDRFSEKRERRGVDVQNKISKMLESWLQNGNNHGKKRRASIEGKDMRNKTRQQYHLLSQQAPDSTRPSIKTSMCVVPTSVHEAVTSMCSENAEPVGASVAPSRTS